MIGLEVEENRFERDGSTARRRRLQRLGLAGLAIWSFLFATLCFADPIPLLAPAVCAPVCTNQVTMTFQPGWLAGPGKNPIVVGPFAADFPFPAFQLVVPNLAGPGGATATALGGVSAVASPDLFGLIFPGGTGVSQSRPAGVPIAAASLDISFQNDWLMTGAFGPPTFELSNFWLGGNVGGGAGDYVGFVFDWGLQLWNPGAGAWNPVFVDGGVARSDPGSCGSNDPFGRYEYFNNVPGPFSIHLDCQLGLLAPPAFNPGDLVRMIGHIEFVAQDDGAGSSGIFLTRTSGNIPEPSTLVLLGVGLVSLAAKRRPTRPSRTTPRP